uniref:Uncharacterized protein n=1 Tax=Anopheles albimanus TaxID=7167 RepID=A0A182FXW0_ANOAL
MWLAAGCAADCKRNYLPAQSAGPSFVRLFAFLEDFGKCPSTRAPQRLNHDDSV